MTIPERPAERPPLRLVTAASASSSQIADENTQPDVARAISSGEPLAHARTEPTTFDSGERAVSGSTGAPTPTSPSPSQPSPTPQAAQPSPSPEPSALSAPSPETKAPLEQATAAPAPAEQSAPVDDGSPVLKPGDIIEGLEIVRKVAQGGMGEVYSAYHPRMRQHLAVKVMLRRFHANADAVERFLEEGRLLAAFSQKEAHIVQIRNVGVDPRCGPWISMEWLVGKSLREVMSGWGGPMPVHQTLLLIISLSDIMHRTHKLGLVHRDLKPENVFVEATSPPRIKLLDLGIAKRADAERTTEETRTIGTLEYMSPEQINKGRATALSDQYAIAHMLYEMLAGKHAFQERMIAAMLDGGAERRNLVLISAHLFTGADPLDPDLAPTVRVEGGRMLSLATILERAMSREPGDRYSTLDAFSADLERWLVAFRALRPAATGEVPIDFDALTRRAPRPVTDSVATLVADVEHAESAAEPAPAALSPASSLRKGGPVRIHQVELTDVLNVYSLLVSSDANEGRYPLAREVVVVGREGGQGDLLLADPSVSRMHCELRHVATGVFQVVDLGSVHGLRFGDIEVRSGILRAGEEVFLGRAKLRLVSPGGYKKTEKGWDFVTNIQTLPPGERATMRMVPMGVEPGGPLLDVERMVPTQAKPDARRMARAAEPRASWSWPFKILVGALVGLCVYGVVRMVPYLRELDITVAKRETAAPAAPATPAPEAVAPSPTTTGGPQSEPAASGLTPSPAPPASVSAAPAASSPPAASAPPAPPAGRPPRPSDARAPASPPAQPPARFEPEAL